MAARDYSLISTPPPNRQPIQTEIYNMGNDEKIRTAIQHELYRNGQVFYVHNVVQTLPGVAAKIKMLVPEATVAMAHGRMTPDQLEDTLVKFANGTYDVLVSTNIVETGLDIPNANTMIIDRAHMMGLSDLHQLRGRVGRSNRQAYCYLLCPNFDTLDGKMRNRLEVIERFSELGSGFSIAMEDLNIRGAGNILGGEQSGFITDIGYDTYQKILNEAIQELKETDFRHLFEEELSKKKSFVRDVQIEMDVEMRIPDNYVNNIAERLSLYSELDRLSNEEEIAHFEQRIEDRFGKSPWQVKELFNGIRVRHICKELGFERLLLRNGVLRCFFVTNPQSPYYDSNMFQRIMQYPIATGDRHVQFKQISNLYTFVHNNTKTVADVLQILNKLSTFGYTSM
jgi:transcription-repair coupling factor (superfamily II helicase)